MAHKSKRERRKQRAEKDDMDAEILEEVYKKMMREFSEKLDAIQFSSLSSTKQTEKSPPRLPDSEALQIKELELKNFEIDLLKQKNELLQKELNITAHDSDISSNKSSSSQTLLFRDVEDSMTKFTGEDEYTVERWITDVEGVAKTCGWNDIQTTTYAKRLLEGCAKKSLRTTSLITSWDELKSFLSKEYATTVNTAVIHKRLASRKRNPGENYRTYLLELLEIANVGNIEDAAVIQYCIDGIDAFNPTKVILYGAENMEEFKSKLKIYEDIAGKQKPVLCSKQSSLREPEQQRRHNNRPRFGVPYRGRCFTCNEYDHTRRECKNKERGPQCYKCNEHGHLAPKCPTLNSDKKTLTVISPATIGKSVKCVQVGGQDVHALVDSGSDLNLVSKRKCEALKLQELQSVPTKFYGIGSKVMETLGHVECEIVVDGESFHTRFHVCPDDLLPCELIIGNELLNHTVTVLSPGNITIKKFAPEVAAVSADIRDDVVVLDHVKNKQYANDVRKAIANYDPTKGSPGHTIQMRIILLDETPIYQKPRRLAPLEKEIVRKQIDEWISDGIVRPSFSQYTSPITLADKKDGSKRLCVDYRRLNKVIVKDRYPMPLIDDQIDQLYGSKYFCTLDLKNGFFHVDMEEESIKYTSFVTAMGQYEFLKVPFGLCNSPAVFGRFINHIFRQLCVNGIVCVYMDDLIVHGTSEKEVVERLMRVLRVAEKNCLQIKWTKCQFLVRRVEYLGYEVEDSRVKPSTTKLKAISKFPEPTTVQQLQRFLGLTGYFRRFVEGYSVKAKPLSDLLRKNTIFKFGSDQHRSFVRLKEALTTAPVLQIYSEKARTELHTDACKVGLAAVLLQVGMEDNQLHPVFYYSYKNTPIEEKYSSYELEALAVVRAVKKFRMYLLGLQFKIVTDCAAFKGTMERKEFTSRIAGWAMYLQEFNYELEHRASTRMRHVDALSRAPILLVVTSEVTNKIKAAQKEDENLRLIYRLLETGPYDNFYISNSILFKNLEGSGVLVVPKSMHKEVIRACHEQGHFGVRKTMELVKREFWFKDMQQAISSALRNCVKCIMVNRKRGRQEGLLNPIPKGDVPLATYHVDHLGHLTASKKAYKHILCVIDSFTKFVWLYPTKTTTTKECIQKLEVQKSIFGNPKTIISDRSTTFTSEEFRLYCEEEEINHHVITTGVPRGNGQVERVNDIIIPAIAKLAYEKPEDWWKHVGRVQRYLNNTYNRAINQSPFELLIGARMRCPEDKQVKDAIETEAIQMFEEKRNLTRQAAKADIEKIQDENRRTYNRKRKPASEYSVGDWVVLKRTQFGTGIKIQPKYLGPYEIVKVRNNDRYDLVKMGEGEGPLRTSASVDLLKRYYAGNSDEEELRDSSEIAKDINQLRTEVISDNYSTEGECDFNCNESNVMTSSDDEPDTGAVLRTRRAV